MQYLPFPMKKYRHPWSKGHGVLAHVYYIIIPFRSVTMRKKTLENLDANCCSLRAVGVRTKIPK